MNIIILRKEYKRQKCPHVLHCLAQNNQRLDLSNEVLQEVSVSKRSQCLSITKHLFILFFYSKQPREFSITKEIEIKN